MILAQGLGDLGDSNVLALQNALKALGKSVTVTGTMNDSTVAALWVVVKSNITKAKQVAALISPDASKAIGWFVDAMNWIDNKVASIPGGLLTTERVLNNWVNINSVASAACFGNSTCLTVAKALADARSTTFAGLTSAAGVFTKVVTAFGGATASNPPQPTSGMVQLPPNKISMIQSIKSGSAFNLKLVQGGAKIATPAQPPPLPAAPPASSKLPAFMQQWWFWALVGLVGGGLYARRAA